MEASRRRPEAATSWKDKEQVFPQSLRRECGSVNTLTLDFWPPEL